MDPNSRHILGMRVDHTSYADAARRIVRDACARVGGYVCVANVHMVMEAFDDREYRHLVNGARLVTPDGVPLVWALRRLGIPRPTRVYGPDLTLAVLQSAAESDLSVGFLGSTPDVLEDLVRALKRRFPKLRIVFMHAPPFGDVSEEQDALLSKQINDSGAQLLFVGLGCPKQERWMAAHEGTLNTVMLGVGAAFDFLSGRKAQAPHCMQKVGLEWAFRLATEPRRLWKRYLKHNPRFIVLLARQLILGAR